MLAFGVVRRLQSWLVLVLVAANAAGAAVAGNKVTLTLKADGGAVARGGSTTLHVLAEIAAGWHVNGHQPSETFLIPTSVRFTLPAGVTTDVVNYPPARRKSFAFAPQKPLRVYQGTVDISAAIHVPATFPGRHLRIVATLHYQACNDSTCSPPATATADLTLPVRATAGPAAATDPQPPGAYDVRGWMARRGLMVTLLLVALLGLGLNLTPCVYPLISVTVAYFGTQGHGRSMRTGLLASLYVLGIALSFAAVGVTAALSGNMFGAALQKPPVLIAIATLLVALALSSFGLFQLQPPAALMRAAGGTTRGALGALFMGLTMGVVAAPCVGPVVLGLLVFVGSRQSVVLGVELFLALGLGMGLPYLGLAMAAGSIQRLPRSGDWLIWIERLFGVVLLGLAGYFLAPVLPPTASRFLLPALIGVGGIYLGFLDRSGRHLRYFRPIKRFVGIAAVAVAVWFAWPLRAESAIRWQPFDSAALTSARAAGRPTLIDFVADWCIPCHEMARTTFADPHVRREARRFTMLKVDVTHETDATTALISRYAVPGVPTVIFIDGSGAEVRRLVGYVAPNAMLAAMRAVR